MINREGSSGWLSLVMAVVVYCHVMLTAIPSLGGVVRHVVRNSYQAIYTRIRPARPNVQNKETPCLTSQGYRWSICLLPAATPAVPSASFALFRMMDVGIVICPMLLYLEQLACFYISLAFGVF
eukprot:scaffold122974_cov17-Prasinocladus_malaysianus.AAC.1